MELHTASVDLLLGLSLGLVALGLIVVVTALAQWWGAKSGLKDVLAFDMGGTTTDVSLIVDGTVVLASPGLMAGTGAGDLRQARTGEGGAYEVTNVSDAPIRAVAAYNVAPYKAGKYFNKVECFCFKEKTLQPGRTERLPVIFFVSPELAGDRYASDVKSITLSYTYYPAGGIPDSARPQDASAGS